MKLLTFFGVGNYKETCYQWENHQHTTRYSPVASCMFLQPDEIMVFLTEDAEIAFKEVQSELPKNIAVHKLPVPLGANDNELWKIFDTVSGCVQAGEDVAFDITHGLRSFPLVGLLAAAFLRASLQINLKAVLYGAFDAGMRISPGKTPMFDLSPMLSLLEWASAADRFNRTGDARYLSALIDAERKGMAIASQGNRNAMEQIGHLNNLASALTDISQTLRLIRPIQTMETVAGLSERIGKARPSLEHASVVRPFSLLLNGIEASFLPLGLSKPLQKENLSSALDVQRKMVGWYIEREQWVQAVTLAREWMVDWFMFHLQLPDLMDIASRERVECHTNEEAKIFIDSKDKSAFQPLFLRNIPDVNVALDIWNRLVHARNDIDHAGMRKQPLKPDALIKQISEINRLLNDLPLT